jgi:hypothetical protein
MKRLLFALVLALSANVLACAPEYDHTDIMMVRSSDPSDRIDRKGIELSEGMLFTAHLLAWNDRDKTMVTRLRSTDPSVLEIANLTTANTYAFMGMKSGVTEIEVTANDALVLIIPVLVRPQSAP